MKILTNKEISFATRVKQGWTKGRLMAQFGLDEKKYYKMLDEIRRIEAKEGKTLSEPLTEPNAPSIIQLYSPDLWHDSQAILMNEEGRALLIKALQSGETKIAIPTFTSDGEGNNLYVQIVSESEFNKSKLPYTDEMCRRIQGEAEKEDPKYPITAEEHNLIVLGKNAGKWKVFLSITPD